MKSIPVSCCRLVAAMALVVLLGCATQQERAERQARTRQAVEQAVNSRRMRISVNSMSTQRYGTRMVTPDFYLELRGDTLDSYLPYLGQAYQASMLQPAQGLHFVERILQLSERHPRAHQTQFDVDVRTQEDTYHYVIDIFDTGKASIRVISQHRDIISFDGDCDLP